MRKKYIKIKLLKQTYKIFKVLQENIYKNSPAKALNTPKNMCGIKNYKS